MSADINEQNMGDTAMPKYLSKRDRTRDISVQYALTADDRVSHNKQFNLLNGFLNTENSKFIFDDEPDVYYIGTVSEISSQLINSAPSEPVSSAGIITIHCTDPRKYSMVEKSFLASTNSDGVLSVTIQNDGTEAVPVDYTIAHNHENGYIGIASEHGVIQLGKMEEADGENYTQSENLASLASFSTIPDDHGINYMHNHLGHQTGGTLAYGGAAGRLSPVLFVNSFGPQVSGKWCGGMRTLTLPPDSEGVYGAKNFYCYINYWFETGLMGQTGEQSIAFLTADNEVICGYSLYKADMSGNTAALEFWINGQMKRSITFEPAAWDSANPFNNGRGHNDIRKEGSKITFYWWGSYPSYDIPEVKDMECHKIQVAFTQYAGRAADRYVTRNYLRVVNYQKVNVEKWKDVPNRYSQNDTVFIDGSDSKVYVNGMVKTDDEITGSTYFLAPPGETTVKFAYSSFCSPAPTITAKIREAWL